MLAGVGTSWYTWLEQGRDIKVSESVARAISRALRLSASEHVYFYRLLKIATISDPTQLGKLDTESDLRDLVDGWLPSPALVLNEFWDILSCNRVAREVFGLDVSDDNLLVAFFTNENCRSRYVQSEMIAKLMVAQSRATMVRNLDNPRFTELAAFLSGRSEEFSRLWNSHEVLEMRGRRKEVQHPCVGRMTFQTHVWQLSGREDISLLLYLPEATADIDKLRRLMQMPEGPAATRRPAQDNGRP